MISQTALLQKYRIQVKGDLGQHLLLDANIIRKIVGALNPQIGQTVVEIGPGLGALTTELLRHGMNVIAIEKDPKFVEILEKELLPEFPDTFHLIHADVLDCDFREICEGLEDVQLVSNLPYYITTPILFKLIEETPAFSNAVLMMQKEVSEKLAAEAGSLKYGRLAAAAGVVGKTQRLFSVSKGCFTPAPAVDSTVIRFSFKPIAQIELKDRPAFLEFIKIAFSERRKTLITLLLSQKGPKPNRLDMELIFKNCDLDLKLRADQLKIEQFANLFLRISRREDMLK